MDIYHNIKKMNAIILMSNNGTLPEDCILAADYQRDCCSTNPLTMCQVFSSFTLLLLLVATTTSIWLFCKTRTSAPKQMVSYGRGVEAKKPYNLNLHLVINLTFLSKTSLYNPYRSTSSVS